MVDCSDFDFTSMRAAMNVAFRQDASYRSDAKKSSALLQYAYEQGPKTFVVTAAPQPRPRVPAYRAVADDLRARIASGEFSPHHALPSAERMAERYKVSRRTAHRAVTVLIDEGLLESVPGYGTFLRDSRLVQIFQISSRLRKGFTGLKILPHELSALT